MDTNLKPSDNFIKQLNRVPYVCLAIMAMIILTLQGHKNDPIGNMGEAVILLMLVFILSSIALEAHFTGEFNIRGVKATRNESPGGFYFAMSSYIFLAIAFFLIFIRYLVKITHGG